MSKSVFTNMNIWYDDLFSHKTKIHSCFLPSAAPVGKPTMTVGKFTIISNHNCALHDHTTTLAWATTADLCHLNIHFILSSSIFSRLQTAHNTSSSSVRVSWKAPPLSTIHGEFLGYRITYRPRDKQQSEDIKEIYIRDSSVEVCDIINLNYESAERRRACASTGHNCHHCVAAHTMAALAKSTKCLICKDYGKVRTFTLFIIFYFQTQHRAMKWTTSRLSRNIWCRFKFSIRKDSDRAPLC